jgi:hypothetical protein
MSVGRFYLLFSILVVVFWATAFVLFKNPSLQFPRMDSYIWPAALALAVLSLIASLVPVFPRGKRLFSNTPHVASLAIGYAILVCNALLGIATAMLIPFRLGI